MVPEAFCLWASLDQPDLADMLAACSRAARAAGLAPVAWSNPTQEPVTKHPIATLDASLDALRAPPAGVNLEFGDGRSVLIYQPGAGWRCNFQIVIGRRWGDALAARRDTLVEVARELFRSGRPRTLALFREGGGPDCIPDVPIAKMHRHVVMTTAAEVEEKYDRPAAFWDSWSAREERGDRVLLFRAMDATDSVSYLRAVLGDQAAMARAAKPRQTRYGLPTIQPEERPLYAAGEPRLLPVGYWSDARAVEYSCVVQPDEHVHVWEIHALWAQLHRRRLPDGRPLEAARVVFFDRDMAEAEKRPLLDVGARVFYQSTATAVTEIAE